MGKGCVMAQGGAIHLGSEDGRGVRDGSLDVGDKAMRDVEG